MTMPNRLAVFDCDGTLVDSQAIICRAMREAFVAEQLAPPEDATIRRVVGLSLTEVMARLHPQADDAFHLRLSETYKRVFQGLRATGQVEEPLFAGVAEALKALDAEGWMLAVATGKSDRGLKHCLEIHDIARYFVSLQTADRHPSKPHPSMIVQAMADAGAVPETCVMIGDTSFDIGMGINAGCLTVGVAWGYHEAEDLFDEGAHYVADRPDQLPDILRTALTARA